MLQSASQPALSNAAWPLLFLRFSSFSVSPGLVWFPLLGHVRYRLLHNACPPSDLHVFVGAAGSCAQGVHPVHKLVPMTAVSCIQRHEFRIETQYVIWQRQHGLGCCSCQQMLWDDGGKKENVEKLFDCMSLRQPAQSPAASDLPEAANFFTIEPTTWPGTMGGLPLSRVC